MKKAVAIIPARGGSKRIPRKNIKPFMGKPMIAWPIESALKSGAFSSVVVSTDDGEIGAIAQKYGARFIKRPPELATDEIDELPAYLHVLDILKGEGVEPDYFCGVYATAVLVAPQDFAQSFRVIDSPPEADVVMGVSGYPIHPYKALLSGKDGYLDMMFPVECDWRSQLYPKVVASNGTFYWFRTSSFRKAPNYYPERLRGYELPPQRAVDMDTEEDFKWAESIARATGVKA